MRLVQTFYMKWERDTNPSSNSATGRCLTTLCIEPAVDKSNIIGVATLDKPVGLGNGDLAVSPDGRWLLYTLLDQAGSELMLVENFH